jgi:hypothetical protein
MTAAAAFGKDEAHLGTKLVVANRVQGLCWLNYPTVEVANSDIIVCNIAAAGGQQLKNFTAGKMIVRIAVERHLT